MNLFSLMRQFTIRFSYVTIAVVLVLLGLLGGRACSACSASIP